VPELPILGKDGLLAGNASYEIWTVMVYPSDQEKRNIFMTSLNQHIYSKMKALSDEDPSLGEEYFKGVVEPVRTYYLERYDGYQLLPRSPNETELLRRMRDPANRGELAGQILYWLIYLDQYSMKNGLGRAKDLAKREAQKSKKRKAKKKFTPQTINKAWKEYESTAHLWAARLWWEFNRGAFITKTWSGYFCYGWFPELTQVGVIDFLRLSEWFRSRAAGIVDTWTERYPSYAPKDPWVPPASLRLPMARMSLNRSPWADKEAKRYTKWIKK